MKKGFSLVFILIIFLLIILIGSGLYLYFNKSETTSKISKVDCNFNLAPQLVSSDLLTKMADYDNYQLDVSYKQTTPKFSWSISRAGNKYSLNDKDFDIIDYLDCDSGKTYSYLKWSNKYADLTNKEGTILSNGVGRPEYYFKSWPANITSQGEEIFEGEKVIVYTAVSNDTLLTAYISSETGLPVRIINKPKNESVKETIINLNFTRLGEISTEEVSVPASAKKFTEKEIEQGEQLINRIIQP